METKQVALTIPIGGEVPECANGITPTDMHTTHACGWEGALFMFGGMGVVIWSRLSLALVDISESAH
jgi:hypothetical protein